MRTVRKSYFRGKTVTVKAIRAILDRINRIYRIGKSK